MSLADTYDAGLDLLGEGIGDFVPWLGIVGKLAGGITDAAGKKTDSKGKGGGSSPLDALKSGDGGGSGPTAAEQIKRAMVAERQRQAMEKAQAEASRSRLILYSVLGVVAVGGVGFAAYAIASQTVRRPR